MDIEKQNFVFKNNESLNLKFNEKMTQSTLSCEDYLTNIFSEPNLNFIVCELF